MSRTVWLCDECAAGRKLEQLTIGALTPRQCAACRIVWPPAMIGAYALGNLPADIATRVARMSGTEQVTAGGSRA